MNILIVDDDILIRNLFSLLIRQIEDFNGNVVSVSNADEAENVCDKQHIDLVITDITMPNRNGLDLIRSLRQKHPKMQIACLSAYDDYEYIRKALKLGVLDYILKSEMKLEDIISLLDKVESFASISNGFVLQQEDIESLHSANNLLEQYLSDDDASMEEICMNIDCTPENSIVVVGFQLCRQLTSMDEMLKAQHIAEKTCESEQRASISFIHEGDRIVMLLKDGSSSMEGRENEMMKLSLLYKRNLEEYSKQNVVFSMYEVAQNVGLLRNTIIKTMDTMDAYEYYPDYSRKQCVLKKLSENDTRILHQYAETNDEHTRTIDRANNLIRQVEQWHREYMIPREIKSAAVCGLFYLMESNTLRSPENLLNYNRYAKHMRYVRDAQSLEKILKDALEDAVSKTKSTKMIDNPSVQSAVKYINANYDHKITLDDVAKYVYMNRTYMSQMFKKHTNVNFADYLEMVRINKAKELLLHTHLPITEIAAKVGYSNQSYFTKVFKQSTGISPNAFRTIAKK